VNLYGLEELKIRPTSEDITDAANRVADFVTNTPHAKRILEYLTVTGPGRLPNMAAGIIVGILAERRRAREATQQPL
jgi:hypothetical protein